MCYSMMRTSRLLESACPMALWESRRPPMDRMTHACENSTFPQLRWGGNNDDTFINLTYKTYLKSVTADFLFKKGTY